MSRLNIIEEHNDGINDVLSIITKKSPKALACDFDTLIYWTLLEKHEDGTPKVLTEEDLPYLEGKLNELVLKIFNKIETHFTLKKIYVFIRGNNNYRKSLYKEYKANRPEKHPLTNALYSYLIKTFNAIPVDNYEAEDACATIGWKLQENCIIAFCDHDLLEIANCIMYNYQKDKWLFQSEKEALWEKYKKLNISEHGDNANFTPQYGIKKFLTDFNKNMSIEEYEEQSFKTYIYCWSDKIKVKNKIQRTPNIEKATEMFNLAKEILWLKEVEIKG
jgi:hypothetical protein